ncbi:MAG: hypothetical protein EBR35_02845 [Flavobacteriales bacterium]|nr:hypothetical protein [Flavobacteriales bacterium]
MRLFIIPFFFIFQFILGCGSNTNDKKVKLQIKKKYYKPEKPTPNKKHDTLIVLFDLYNQDSVNLGITKISPNLEKTFIERFPNKKIFNFILESKNSTVKHLQIDYLDSNSMKNAFFNFLDCYGKDCKSIELFQKVKFSKIFFMLITTTKSIHIIESDNNLNSSEWINCVRFSKIADPIKFIIIQKKQQKAKWFSYSNFHLTEVK